MKVAIIAYGHCDNVLCLAHHLSKYADITLIFVTAGNRFTRSIFDWDISSMPFGLTTDAHIINQYLGREIRGFVNPGLKILIGRTPTRSVVKDWRRKNLKSIREIAAYINENRYDVVHFNGFSGFQLYFHWFLRRKPKVYTIHDYLPHSGEWRISAVMLHGLYTKLNYQFIQHYKYLSTKFSEFYGVQPKNIHTVYCGPLEVYRAFADEAQNEEPNTILFFGRISPYKGIEYLIKAFRTVLESIPEARLIIAGHGEFPFTFNNNGAYEIYNYHISNEELVKLIQRASIVVAPYTDATHSAVMMTAFAFNKPVVATAVGGIPEVIDDGVTGVLVPPRNTDALGHAIIKLLSDRNKRAQMRNNIERMSSDSILSWNKIAQKTIEVYRTALKGYRS